jgi:endonuclease-8
MPEGDSIFRAARTLHRALAGKRVTTFDSVLPALTRVHQDSPITGRTIESVSAAGKHLVMRFSGDLLLRTHMRMHGSWHIYRPGERWQRPRRDMRIVVGTEDFQAVGFNIPVAEMTSGGGNRSRALGSLGPDLLSDDFDADEALRRMRAAVDTEVADVLLDQRILAGLGNVYKSEVLFMCSINPGIPVRLLDDRQLARLIDVSKTMLRRNVSEGVAPMTTYGGLRRTTARDDPSGRLWVYGRARLPCRKCGSPILVRPQGPNARLTYWCANCQPVPRTPDLTASAKATASPPKLAGAVERERRRKVGPTGT